MNLEDRLKWNRKKTAREAAGLGRRVYRIVRDVGVFRAEIMSDGKLEKSQPCIDFEDGRTICQKHHDGVLVKARELQRRRHGIK